MNGQRIAILGAGRSGRAIAQAAVQLGAKPTIYDRTSEQSTKFQEISEGLGFPIVGGWDQPFTAREADLVVTSPGVPMQSETLRGTVRNGISVIGEIEFAWRIAKAPILAVTGTNGKSTTAVMTYVVLKELGLDPILCGNIFGSGYDEVPLTEGALHAAPEQVLVAEISSFQLEWVDGWHAKAAAITVIGSDHLDRYNEDQALYAATKQRIFANMDTGDTAVLPYDFMPVPRGPRCRYFGHESADANATKEELMVLGRAVSVETLPFQEMTNLRNAQAAVLLACGYAGANRAGEALGALRAFQPLANRMELAGEGKGLRFINNSMCTNPEAVIASSKSVEANQRLLIGGKRKGLTFFDLGDYLAASPHHAYLYGADARDIGLQMGTRWPIFETLAEAFAQALKDAHNGEVVMLAPGCASQDQFEDFRHRGDVFKQLAKEWLSQ